MWEPSPKQIDPNSPVSEFAIIRGILDNSKYDYVIHHFEPLQRVREWGNSRIIDVIDPVNEEDDIMLSFYCVGGECYQIANRYQFEPLLPGPSWLVSCQNHKSKWMGSMPAHTWFPREYYNRFLGIETKASPIGNVSWVWKPQGAAEMFRSIVGNVDFLPHADLRKGSGLVMLGENIVDVLASFYFLNDELTDIYLHENMRIPNRRNIPSYLISPPPEVHP